MTWNSPRDPDSGTQRTRMAFAWLPIRDGDRMIWLEWVYLSEEFQSGYWHNEGRVPGFWAITNARQAG